MDAWPAANSLEKAYRGTLSGHSKPKSGARWRFGGKADAWHEGCAQGGWGLKRQGEAEPPELKDSQGSLCK